MRYELQWKRIWTQWFSSDLIYIFLIGLLSAVYLCNLNYNSPLTDEAIYIVLGKLGLFQWDWTSYGAGNWMAGSLYTYPPLTALAYTSFGIVGSRLLNVIFGLASVITVAAIAAELVPPRIAYTTRLATLFVFGFSGLSLLVSRLATYDMPAFYFFFLSFYALIKAIHTQAFLGKWYFLSLVSLMLAIFMKVIILGYAPFLIALACYHALFKSPLRHRFYFWRYYLLPLSVIGLIYLIFQIPGLLVYFSTHRDTEIASYPEIIGSVSQYLLVLTPLWLIGTLLLLYFKRVYVWAAITLAAVWIIGLHAAAHRLATFDKHLYFTHAFVSILVGIGLAYLIDSPNSHFKPAILVFVFIIIIPTLTLSAAWGFDYGQTWENTTGVSTYLQTVIKTGDYVLSAAGPASMLATYSLNHPLQTTTFDWFEYQGHEGAEAYSQAVKDAHFNYILLYKNIDQVNDSNQQVQQIVESSRDNTYQPVYQDYAFIVYKREYL
ncbi:hypothetical protein A2W24_01530 [Microgenomates group bacterium RBG_16_45_19]|nr:MAG: hypothetical protein A2W24_01530 [Microgenomates group bacterium RBG_16_45_19]